MTPKRNGSIPLKLASVTLAGALGLGGGLLSPVQARSSPEMAGQTLSGPVLVSQVFQPPEDSAPKDSTGGASRGEGTFQPPDDAAPSDSTAAASRGDAASLVALMPETNIGRTVAARPTFFVYVPPAQTGKGKQVFFSLQDENQNPHYQTRIEIPRSGGIVSFQLPEAAPELEVGKNYKWFFIVTESGKRLRADTSGVTGWVKRVEPAPEMLSKQKLGASLELVKLYGAQGVWYDTLATLAELRQKQPSDSTVAAQWRQLLEQVGLGAIANQAVTEIALSGQE
ncbi:MAG: DUF928 domain-containing protein [Oscillatoria princeps RMCB-10]|nr:DUF928 domain-containing protein [Oscillatoria princeps RMCB-10]